VSIGTSNTLTAIGAGEIAPALGRPILTPIDRRRGRRMPSRADVDPTELRENLGQIHLLDIEGPQRFRYRLHGSLATNPDAKDMTGLTTRDYTDHSFAELVTRHLAECVRDRNAVSYDIKGELDGQPIEYARIALPLAHDGERANMIMSGSVRRTIPAKLLRTPHGLS
jgi:hypothetical protein